MSRFYKTTFVVEVLSEEPLGDCLSLSQIDYAISEGPCVGRINETEVKELTPKEVADALYDFGSLAHEAPGTIRLAGDDAYSVQLLQREAE